MSFDKDDISCFIYCKNCVSAQNPKGELLVFTKTAGLKLTDKNIENNENLKFFPIDKSKMDYNMANRTPKDSIDKQTGTDEPTNIEPAIQFEIKPLFGNDELPIANAYIQYLLKWKSLNITTCVDF